MCFEEDRLGSQLGPQNYELSFVMPKDPQHSSHFVNAY